MTTERLISYRSVRRQLERTPGLDPEHAEMLRDHAEGLLLCGAEDGEQADQLEAAVALLLSDIAASGALGDVRAEALFFRIAACGPAGRLARLA